MSLRLSGLITIFPNKAGIYSSSFRPLTSDFCCPQCPLCSSREAIWFSKNNPGNPCLPRSSGRWYWGKSCLIQQRNPRNPCPKIEVTYFSTSVPLFRRQGLVCSDLDSFFQDLNKPNKYPLFASFAPLRFNNNFIM